MNHTQNHHTWEISAILIWILMFHRTELSRLDQGIPQMVLLSTKLRRTDKSPQDVSKKARGEIRKSPWRFSQKWSNEMDRNGGSKCSSHKTGASNGLIQSRLAILADQHRCSRELCHDDSWCVMWKSSKNHNHGLQISIIIHYHPSSSIIIHCRYLVIYRILKLLRLPVAQWTTIPLGLCCRKSQAGPRWSISKLKIHKK